MPSLTFNEPIFHYNISTQPAHIKFFRKELYPTLTQEGKYQLDIAMRFGYNRLSPRHGTWVTPFPTVVLPEYAMPSYDSTFNKNFADITNQRAIEIQQKLQKDPECKIALYYSGGMDSLTVLISLLQNLQPDERKRLAVCCSMDSVIEYPAFFEKYIIEKLQTIDLKMGKIRLCGLIDQGYTVITADAGDSMFGTEVSTQLYYSYKNYCKDLGSDAQLKFGNLLNEVSSKEIHYSAYADLLIAYFGYNKSPGFGFWYYEKLDALAKSSEYPVYSLHDFFWQVIFNIKWMHCSLRAPVFFGDHQDQTVDIKEKIINWYCTDDYQRWSMVNNNTGQKIRGITAATYKWAAREYIYNFTKDDWYRHFKVKLASLPKISIVRQQAHADDVNIRFGLSKDYQVLRFNDPGVRDYIIKHLSLC